MYNLSAYYLARTLSDLPAELVRCAKFAAASAVLVYLLLHARVRGIPRLHPRSIAPLPPTPAAPCCPPPARPPALQFNTATFVIIAYWFGGLRRDAGAFFGLLFSLVLVTFTAESWGLLIGGVFMEAKTAQVMSAKQKDKQ